MAYIALSIIAGLASLYAVSTVQAIGYGLVTLFMLTFGKNILAMPVLMMPRLFVSSETKRMPHVATHIRLYDWCGFIFAYAVFVALVYWYSHPLVVIALLTFVADCFFKRHTEAVFGIR